MAFNRQRTRRLPGFRFEAQAPPREDVLPRMDVAVFVGFARSGPVGIPVVVESIEQFEAIFGENLALVGDKGETIYAYLAPTVRAFFRNGGVRCWIVRVARLEAAKDFPENRACYNYFPIPALAGVRFDKSGQPEIIPVLARARAKGSWSDDWQVGAALLSRAIKFINLENQSERSAVELEIDASDPLKTGELLRFDFEREGFVWLLAADSIVSELPPEGASSARQSRKRVTRVCSSRSIWLEKPILSSPQLPEQIVQVKLWTRQSDISSANSADFLKDFGETFSARFSFSSSTPSSIKLEFSDLPTEAAPALGSIITAEYEGKTLCLQVKDLSVSRVQMQETVLLSCQGMFVSHEPPDFVAASPAQISPARVERLAFELWVKKDAANSVRLSDVAFNEPHERFWGNLPTDEQLHRTREGDEGDPPAIQLWSQVGDLLRFPLAGNDDRQSFYFPFLLQALPENYLGAIRLKGTKLERDGMAVFDENLFLDPKLKNTGVGALLKEGEFIRYLSPRPRRLWGIHAALVPENTLGVAAESSPTNPTYTSLSLEEATIIAVPDALHRGWTKTRAGATASPPETSEPPLRPEWWRFQDCNKPDIKPVAEPLWENFLDCRLRIIPPPEDFRVEGGDSRDGTYKLLWESDLSDKSLRFVLEESASRDFEPATVIYAGKQKVFTVYDRLAGSYYYRVKAEIGGEVSNWSNGLVVSVAAAQNWAAVSEKDYQPDVLLAVQRALLRLCAARGDVFAVLDLPEHYRKEESLAHISTLTAQKGAAPAKAGVEPFSNDELIGLSYGAVYHPWLITQDGAESAIRNVPPSGAAAGVIAQRAARRGAWIAPANEVLSGVLGLATRFESNSFQDFQDGFINLVRHEPQGFLVLNADTLSDQSDWRPINVRRLISLLRRLALKHGAEYVFESNDERFRRLVQRGFVSLLDLMFARGAFAGATPAASYQVNVSEALNTRQSVEQGRFIVELRVAPSLPLKFVNVRLVQSGNRAVITEGR